MVSHLTKQVVYLCPSLICSIQSRDGAWHLSKYTSNSKLYGFGETSPTLSFEQLARMTSNTPETTIILKNYVERRMFLNSWTRNETFLILQVSELNLSLKLWLLPRNWYSSRHENLLETLYFHHWDFCWQKFLAVQVPDLTYNMLLQ